MELLAVGLGAAALALAAGWWLWGRALFAARVAGAALTAELKPLREQTARLAEVERQRGELAEAVAAHKATEVARDLAHREQLARLDESFGAIAGKALTDAQKNFVELAGETLKGHRTEATKDLDASKAALADLISPMRETLGKYEAELKAVEAARNEAYGGLRAQIAEVALGQDRVQAEASRLVTALRSSGKTSGAWGELQLENVLEKAGLKKGLDFDLQVSAASDNGGKRPDAVINLPGGGRLIVDSKCSLNDYLAAVEAADEEARQAALDRHLACVRAHVKALGAKSYWKDQDGSAEFVVLFMPGDNLLAAALERDPALLGWAREQRVLLTGPTNLVALATNVAMVRRQEKLAAEAEAIGKLGGELFDSIALMAGHVATLGKSLGGAVSGYNAMIGSLDDRVLSRARRLRDMGSKAAKAEITEPKAIEATLRASANPALAVQMPPLLTAE